MEHLFLRAVSSAAAARAPVKRIRYLAGFDLGECVQEFHAFRFEELHYTFALRLDAKA